MEINNHAISYNMVYNTYRHCILVILSLFLCSHAQGQNMDTCDTNDFRVSATQDHYKDCGISTSWYEFFNRNITKAMNDTIQPLFAYSWIDYGENHYAGRHAVLNIRLNEDYEQTAYYQYLDKIFSHALEIFEYHYLTDVTITIPFNESLSISSKLERDSIYIALRHRLCRKIEECMLLTQSEKDYLDYFDSFVKKQIAETYLYNHIDSLLRENSLVIENIVLDEHVVSYTKDWFLEYYPQYKGHNLPNEILGIFATFEIKRKDK